MSLFDGSRTLQEIKDLCTEFVKDSGDPHRDAGKFINDFVKKFSKPVGSLPFPILTAKSRLKDQELLSIRRYNPADFAISSSQWKPLPLDEYRYAFPLDLLWLLTNVCQVRCQYCFMQKPLYPGEEMLPWERVREIVHEAHQGGVVSILISGGDMMCYPWIFDFIELLGQYEFTFPMIVTKSYLSLERAERLAAFPNVETVQFGIDSTVPETGDYLVRSPGFVKRILASIENARNANLKVITKTVITPYNLPTIPRLFRDFKKRGVSEIHLATYCRSAYNHQDKLFNHPDDYKWLDHEIAKLEDEFPEDRIFIQNGRPETGPVPMEEKRRLWRNRRRCLAGREQISICANGKVVADEQMPERDEDFLGDLRTQSLEEIWNGQKVDEYLRHPPREKFKGTVCYDCPEEEFHECQSLIGPSVRDSMICYGTRWAPNPDCPKAPGAPRIV